MGPPNPGILGSITGPGSRDPRIRDPGIAIPIAGTSPMRVTPEVHESRREGE